MHATRLHASDICIHIPTGTYTQTHINTNTRVTNHTLRRRSSPKPRKNIRKETCHQHPKEASNKVFRQRQRPACKEADTRIRRETVVNRVRMTSRRSLAKSVHVKRECHSHSHSPKHSHGHSHSRSHGHSHSHSHGHRNRTSDPRILPKAVQSVTLRHKTMWKARSTVVKMTLLARDKKHRIKMRAMCVFPPFFIFCLCALIVFFFVGGGFSRRVRVGCVS